MRTGIANLPLHFGDAPPWLFKRMKRLGKGISEAIIDEHGPVVLLERVSDPYWFQAFSCVLGFDWHSSGTTTVTCGVLKETLSKEMGVVALGGKGRTSKKTPEEIDAIGGAWGLSEAKTTHLKYASRMAAKVDNCLVQDGYQLYHHSFLLTEKGDWAVIQQGMNPENRYARRYHWLDREVESFVEEPQKGICCDEKRERVLNLVAKESREARKASVDLVKEHPKKTIKYFIASKPTDFQKTLNDFDEITFPRAHGFNKRIYESLLQAYEIQPQNYEELVSLKGVGPKTIRALALVSELVYGAAPSWRDPVKYSFAHGGKDGIPYPVDRTGMDETTEILKNAIADAKIGKKEKLEAIRHLIEFVG
ncbi:DUF763 domain-containing protein [Candidatus Micrarchaeota archaeon]|nr:DUF763 domain-containing protein [Candidatus Micrarchaeota archaeon]